MKLLISILTGILFHFPGFAAANPIELSLENDTAQSTSNQYYSYNFGGVRVNWSQYADFSLINNGRLHIALYGGNIYINLYGWGLNY